MAVDAVLREPVSTPNSLLTGKITGNFEKTGLFWRKSLAEALVLQCLARKFPKKLTGNFFRQNRENSLHLDRYQGKLARN